MSINFHTSFGEFFAIFVKNNPCKILQKITSEKFDMREMSEKTYLDDKNKMDDKMLRMV